MVVKSIDSGTRLVEFKAGYAVIFLCDLGQVTQPQCALNSSYVKHDKNQYHTWLLKDSIVLRILAGT